MPRPIALLTAVLVASSLGYTTGLDAQARRTVRGEVRDTAGHALDHVEVLALASGRTARTGADGRFAIDGVALGEERFLFRRLGYHRVEATFAIDRVDDEILVRLTPLPLALDPVIVRGRRTGLFGLVGDVAYQAIGDVEVQVLGAGEGAMRTDSLGRFAMPSLAAGNYILLLRKRGYYPVRRSVTLPPGEYREVSLLLTPIPAGLAGRRLDRTSGFGGFLDFAWDTHASRRVRCGDGNSVLVPREELVGEGRATLDVALSRAASVAARGFARWELRDYALFVDGQNAQGWPLSAIRAEDVEAVEIYRGNRQRPVFRMGAFSNAAARASSECPRGTIWIWLK